MPTRSRAPGALAPAARTRRARFDAIAAPLARLVRRCATGGLVVVATAAGTREATAQANSTAGDAPLASGSGFWRDKNACGANGLFLLAGSRGATVPYVSWIAELAPGADGVSLDDLARVATKHGFPCRAVRLEPRNLARVELPILVHLDHYSGRADALGHFMILTSYDEAREVVGLIDPNTVLAQGLTVDAFRRSWSGFALLPENPRDASGLATWAGIGAVLAALLHRRTSRASGSPPQAVRPSRGAADLVRP